MYIRDFFLPIKKNIPLTAKLASHKYMLQSGMISQLSSGVYTWLPLGTRILRKLENFIKSELDSIGAQEIILPTLQPLSIWNESGRAVEKSDLNSQIFHLKDESGSDFVLPPSGEEAVTVMLKKLSESYKDLDKIFYQITHKFRDEIRPRHGVMRAKEFVMKDAYSFNSTKKESLNSYEKMFNLYLKIFRKLGLKVLAVSAPTGAMGGDFSNEFHVLSPFGESKVYFDESSLKLCAKEPYIHLADYMQHYAVEDDHHQISTIKKKDIECSNSIEVAHIFDLGTKYTQSLSYFYQLSQASKLYPYMGCYGIGISRLLAAMIECRYHNNKMFWPKQIAPFSIAVVNLNPKNSECHSIAEKAYAIVKSKTNDVIYDNEDLSVGKKLFNIDMIGIPIKIIIGNRSAVNGSVEIEVPENINYSKKISVDALEKYLTESLFLWIHK